MLYKLLNKFNQLKTHVDIFLFGKNNFEQLALLRIILCGTLFYMACFRQFNVDQLGPNSLIPRDMALNIFPDFYRPFVQWFFWPDAFVGTVHMILISLLFLAMIGLINRPLLILTWIIHQGILNRNYSILFGADVIGGLFLFYLSFTKCTEVFSVRSLIFKKQNSLPNFDADKELPVTDYLSSIFFRIIQIQLCAIYMYTGFEKLKGKTWWDGTALWTVFANPQFSQYDFKFLSNVPLFFAISTFLSIIFEVYFAPMVMNKSYRNLWLLGGVVFHVSIGILLGLMAFSMVMLSTYVLFLEKEFIISQVSFLKKNCIRLRQIKSRT